MFRVVLSLGDLIAAVGLGLIVLFYAIVILLSVLTNRKSKKK